MITGPKNTLSAGIARKVVKRAQQKALAKDTATVLAGIRKAATGVGCPGAKIRSGGLGRGLGRGRGKGPLGVPVGVKVAPQAKAKDKNKKKLVKAAAVAMVALKRGTEMQKRAAIAQMLHKLRPCLASASKPAA